LHKIRKKHENQKYKEGIFWDFVEWEWQGEPLIYDPQYFKTKEVLKGTK